MLAAMTERRGNSRILTQRREIGRSTPRAFTRTCWWRFASDRRGGYIRRVGGQPDERQGLIIAQMIEAEWNKLRCEHEARSATGKAAYELMKLAAEWSRQLLLLDRALASATPRPVPAKARPGPPQLSLEDHLEILAQREGAA
jgi:hypothetical protein